MTWKDFKKKNISLNYTVMLLPHSQKKPIHFKTPVWTFGLFFLFLLFLTGSCLFFAGSRLQLKRVKEEKAQLEQEWELLAEQKRQAEEENETLRLARELQGSACPCPLPWGSREANSVQHLYECSVSKLRSSGLLSKHVTS